MPTAVRTRLTKQRAIARRWLRENKFNVATMMQRLSRETDIFDPVMEEADPLSEKAFLLLLKRTVPEMQ